METVELMIGRRKEATEEATSRPSRRPTTEE